jgi:hypothetical protein
MAEAKPGRWLCAASHPGSPRGGISSENEGKIVNTVRIPLLGTLMATLILGACASAPPAQKSAPATPAPVVQTKPKAGPATKPSAAEPSAEHLAVARRFLHGFGAGAIAMKGLRTELEKQAKDQPGVAELVRRAFVDVDEQDFEILAARVYARHMNQQHLTDLAGFIESKTGSRFFNMAIEGAMSGKPQDSAAAIRQFNADELTEIMKFLQSDSFIALQKVLPTINAEMKQEGEKLGEALLLEYLGKK